MIADNVHRLEVNLTFYLFQKFTYISRIMDIVVILLTKKIEIGEVKF